MFSRLILPQQTRVIRYHTFSLHNDLVYSGSG